MAGSKSNYLENAVLDHILGGTDYSRSGTVYIALYTVAPTDAGGGTEVTGGSYARATVTNNATNFPAAITGTKTTGTSIKFAQASSDWGVIVAMGILDSISGGNLLYWGDLTNSKSIESGDTAEFAIGGITLTED